MADARLRKFSVVLVSKVDCFPLSMKQLVDTVLELDGFGIYYRAVSHNLSSDQKDPMGQSMLKLFTLLAQQERGVVVERVRAGMMETLRQGKHCGRPGRIWRCEPAVELRAKGWSWRRIAQHLNIPVTSVRRAIRQSQNPSYDCSAGVPKWDLSARLAVPPGGGDGEVSQSQRAQVRGVSPRCPNLPRKTDKRI